MRVCRVRWQSLMARAQVVWLSLITISQRTSLDEHAMKKMLCLLPSPCFLARLAFNCCEKDGSYAATSSLTPSSDSTVASSGAATAFVSPASALDDDDGSIKSCSIVSPACATRTAWMVAFAVDHGVLLASTSHLCCSLCALSSSSSSSSPSFAARCASRIDATTWNAASASGCAVAKRLAFALVICSKYFLRICSKTQHHTKLES